MHGQTSNMNAWHRFQWAYSHRYWVKKAAWHRATKDPIKARHALDMAQWCRKEYANPTINRKIA